jgi:NADH-quinone oxidoreductase subunit L
MRYIWLIPLLPGLGAAINGLIGVRWFSRRTAGVVACTMMTAALALSLAAFWQLLALPPDGRAFDVGLGPWIPRIPLQTRDGIGLFEVPWGFRLDPLAGMMLLIVTGIGTLIHIYSTAYMADEPRGGVARYFCYLNLFCFFMLMLVLGDNFLVMFVGWEGVGLCSYLLIGYWYEKRSASDAGKKAFITNRIGDWGFILGVFLVYFTFGTFDFRGVYMLGRNAVLFSHAPMVLEGVAIVGVLTALMAASIGLVQYDIKRVLAYSTVSQLGYMFTAMGVGAFAAGAFHLMTHAFFKALLFLGSGSVIHAMAGEQDMRRMGSLKKYMPVTFATMMIGTLAIAGIFPFAGFFSKDEILFQAFQHNKAVWVVAVITAAMTAFYMFRLMSMTFFGAYRGPAWESAGHGAVATAAKHRAPHPADPRAHSRANPKQHDVSHGPAEPHDAGGGHGHGAWHGPHESPTPITFPLMALAVGAIVAGLVGVPAVLGGSNTIEHFLEPSFKAEGPEPGARTAESVGSPQSALRTPQSEEPHASPGVELGLMGFSLVVAVAGIAVAYRFYVTRPEISDRLAERFAGAHRTLLNKYYVDELYNATVVAGTMESGRGLWAFDRQVVDGAVNGTGWITVIGSWFSGLTDRTVVDGVVNLVGWIVQESSLAFRRFQTGLVQNYALLMVFGIFVFVGIYLFLR